MKWLKVIGLVPIWLWACGSTEPAGPIVAESDLEGSWTIQLVDTANCAGVVTVPMALTLQVRQCGECLAGGVEVVNSTWQSALPGVAGWVDGLISTSEYLDGRVGLWLTQGSSSAIPPDSLRHTLDFIGNLSKGPTITGQLMDPGKGRYPVHQPNQTPILSGTTCVYQAVATHD